MHSLYTTYAFACKIYGARVNASQIHTSNVNVCRRIWPLVNGWKRCQSTINDLVAGRQNQGSLANYFVAALYANTDASYACLEVHVTSSVCVTATTMSCVKTAEPFLEETCGPYWNYMKARSQGKLETSREHAPCSTLLSIATVSRCGVYVTVCLSFVYALKWKKNLSYQVTKVGRLLYCRPFSLCAAMAIVYYQPIPKRWNHALRVTQRTSTVSELRIDDVVQWTSQQHTVQAVEARPLRSIFPGPGATGDPGDFAAAAAAFSTVVQTAVWPKTTQISLYTVILTHLGLQLTPLAFFFVISFVIQHRSTSDKAYSRLPYSVQQCTCQISSPNTKPFLSFWGWTCLI